MKKLLVITLSLMSFASFAQTQKLRAGDTTNLQCPAGTSIEASKINNRTLSVSCARSCQVSIVGQCDYWVNYERSSGTCNGYTDYFLVVRLPNNDVKKIYSNAVSKEVALASLETAADQVVEYGWCEKASF